MMQLFKALLVFFISIALLAPAIAQNTTNDSITTAKNYIEKGKIQEANHLLAEYVTYHSNELNGLWLYAQTCYWLYDFSTARKVYTNAMERFPENYYLKLDYAKVLVNMGYYKQGEQLLITYLQYDTKNIESQYYIAILNYSQGYYNNATIWADKILTALPNYTEVIKLKNDIALLKAPVLEINSSYYADDQPLKLLSNNIKLGKNLGSLLFPTIEFSNLIFTANDSSYSANQLQMGNRFNLAGVGTAVSLNAGVVIDPSGNSNFIGSAIVNKKLGKYFSLLASGQRFQYFYTTKSVDSNILATKLALAVGYDKPKIATAKIGYERNFFDYNNNVSSLYSWVLGPKIKLFFIELRIGYAFSSNTSDRNLYVPKQTMPEIIAAGPTNLISGYYDPYFTPTNQVSHSILANIYAPFSKYFSLSINSNIGVSASIDNPYFFLNNNAGNLFIDKGFYKARYSPLQLNTVVNYNINDKISINAAYAYNKTFFFNSKNVSLGIKCNLNHESKGK